GRQQWRKTHGLLLQIELIVDVGIGSEEIVFALYLHTVPGKVNDGRRSASTRRMPLKLAEKFAYTPLQPINVQVMLELDFIAKLLEFVCHPCGIVDRVPEGGSTLIGRNANDKRLPAHLCPP